MSNFTMIVFLFLWLGHKKEETVPVPTPWTAEDMCVKYGPNGATKGNYEMDGCVLVVDASRPLIRTSMRKWGDKWPERREGYILGSRDEPNLAWCKCLDDPSYYWPVKPYKQ